MFSWVKNLKKGLTRSSTKINDGLKRIFTSKKIDEDQLEELQDLLLSSDIGVTVTEEIIATLRKKKIANNDLKSVKKNSQNNSSLKGRNLKYLCPNKFHFPLCQLI